ncbi:MAG: hypothetical protein R2816_11460 [Flavobacteriaceae bacterium]
MKFKQILILLFLLALANKAIAQGYQKDSLQIKVYTEIEYEQYRVKSIKATKVFCDYCSEIQSEKIKEEALRLAYLARHNRDYIMDKGIKKLAMYIRVSKKDFAALKEDDIDN